MKRALPLVLVLCFGCPDSASQPTFTEVGSPGGGIGPGGAVTGVTAVTAGTSTVSTGAGMLANCECIYEAGTLNSQAQTCHDCVIPATSGNAICASQLTACSNNQDCTIGLQATQTAPPDADALTQILNSAGDDGKPLLIDYFNCLCSDPAACATDCHNNGSTCTGLGGAGGAAP